MKESGSKQDPIIQRVHFINVGVYKKIGMCPSTSRKLLKKYLHRRSTKENYQTLTSHNDIQ